MKSMKAYYNLLTFSYWIVSLRSNIKIQILHASVTYGL